MTNWLSLWICGDTCVELRSVVSGGSLSEPIWRWDSRDAHGLSAEQRSWFHSLDEVKPVTYRGDPCVLVCSSYAGGVALIRRADGAVLCAHSLVNAHSAELLPDGWLAMAGSDGSDMLRLVPVDAGELENTTIARKLPHGHGAVWDQHRELLWTCEWQHVRAHRWQNRELTEVFAIELPTTGAHDLQPEPVSSGLVVTTNDDVWQVNLDTHMVSAYAPLQRQPLVKSISIDPKHDVWCYVQGAKAHWWSDRIVLVDESGTHQAYQLPGRHLYKARWDQSCQIVRSNA
jgi:hypothetical protein